MKKLIVVTAAACALMIPVAKAELVNDFNCTLNKGFSVPQLYAFQQEWMAAARKHGFDEADDILDRLRRIGEVLAHVDADLDAAPARLVAA